jgi:hypothetical protein
MKYVSTSTLWRPSFVNALRLLGMAVARLPLGGPDPVICDASAVELYTGGLWPSANLEVLAAEARPLVGELFSVGFRWEERPPCRDTGLWHPKFSIGVNVIEGLTDLDLAARSNVVRVALDEPSHDAAGVTQEWLSVVGIEDLIVQQITSWLARRAVGENIPARIDVLDALWRAGVGGRSRVGYLQRRLAWETHGEVELGSWLSYQGAVVDPAPRTTAVTRMRAVIANWRAQRGLFFHTSESSDVAGGRDRTVRRRSGLPRAEQSSVEPSNVVPSDTALLSLCVRD